MIDQTENATNSTCSMPIMPSHRKFPLRTGASATIHDSNSEKQSRSARISRPARSSRLTAHPPPHSRLPGWRTPETDTGRQAQKSTKDSKNPKNGCLGETREHGNSPGYALPSDESRNRPKENQMAPKDTCKRSEAQNARKEDRSLRSHARNSHSSVIVPSGASPKLIVAFVFCRLLDPRSGKNEHRIKLREFLDVPIVLLPLIASVDRMECLGPPNNKKEHLVGLVGQPHSVHANRHAKQSSE